MSRPPGFNKCAMRSAAAAPGSMMGGPTTAGTSEVAGGALARARLLIAVEDHGAGTQYVRFGIRPKCSGAGLAAIAFFPR